MLVSFMPLYVIFSGIEKNMADDSINNVRGLGRINKYTGANLVIIFLSWSGLIYYVEPFIKYFNSKDFLQMGALNIITLVVLLAALAFFFLNAFRIIFQVFKKPVIEATRKILFSKFLYVYITFYSLIIIIAAVLVFLKIINIDISFMNFEITEFNF
jgi:NADH:ubiquinone oxidoreductase subunit 5 (subunit L)/multisubunit Na+/H+ antiporter MnhA subunit